MLLVSLCVVVVVVALTAIAMHLIRKANAFTTRNAFCGHLVCVYALCVLICFISGDPEPDKQPTGPKRPPTPKPKHATKDKSTTTADLELQELKDPLANLQVRLLHRQVKQKKTTTTKEVDQLIMFDSTWNPKHQMLKSAKKGVLWSSFVWPNADWRELSYQVFCGPG